MDENQVQETDVVETTETAETTGAEDAGIETVSSLLDGADKSTDEVAEEIASEQAEAMAQQLQQVSAADVVNPYAQINTIGQTPYE